MLRLGVVADAPRAQGLERRLPRLVHRTPPLERDQRLDPGVAPLTRADRVSVRLRTFEPAALPQPVEHPLARVLL